MGDGFSTPPANATRSLQPEGASAGHSRGSASMDVHPLLREMRLASSSSHSRIPFTPTAAEAGSRKFLQHVPMAPKERAVSKASVQKGPSPALANARSLRRSSMPGALGGGTARGAAGDVDLFVGLGALRDEAERVAGPSADQTDEGSGEVHGNIGDTDAEGAGGSAPAQQLSPTSTAAETAEGSGDSGGGIDGAVHHDVAAEASAEQATVAGDAIGGSVQGITAGASRHDLPRRHPRSSTAFHFRTLDGGIRGMGTYGSFLRKSKQTNAAAASAAFTKGLQQTHETAQAGTLGTLFPGAFAIVLG